MEFDEFWEASTLDTYRINQFAQRLNTYDSDSKELMLEYPLRATRLPHSRTNLNKLAKKRQSQRVFSGRALSLKELGLVLSSFYAWNGLEHRGYPSAGATYVTEIYGVAFNVDGYNGKVLYYDAEQHGTVVVGEAPAWETVQPFLNITVDGTPGLLIIFALFPERAIEKYGERGGRFALLEAGAAMQQLALQISESSNLKGVAVGGILDETWKRILKLQDTNAKIALGYLVGK